MAGKRLYLNVTPHLYDDILSAVSETQDEYAGLNIDRNSVLCYLIRRGIEAHYVKPWKFTKHPDWRAVLSAMLQEGKDGR